jgi:predicted flap endonuclease-1-like 5' DNA nuclease
MEPLLWWWRWWTGVDPDRDKALVEAQESMERQQAHMEQLSSELESRDTRIGALQKQMAESNGELQRLRARIDELEHTASEADRLRARINELEHTASEADRLRARINELEHTAAEADRLRAEVDELRAELADSAARQQASTPTVAEQQADAGEPDVSEAASVLGKQIKLDDFTMIEGIGPKIADLLDDAGITTWRQLSETDPAELRQMLNKGGSRFRMHDPTNWPAQAALLTHGRWEEYKELTTKLHDQRAGTV